MPEQQLLTESEAAALLTLKPRTLARWRWAGIGPVFRKIGGSVRYSRLDLDEYLEGTVRQSTSDQGPDLAGI